MPFRFPPNGTVTDLGPIPVGVSKEFVFMALPNSAHHAAVNVLLIDGRGNLDCPTTSVVGIDGAYSFRFRPSAEGECRLRVTVTATGVPPTEVKVQAVTRAAEAPTIETTDEDDPHATTVNHVHRHTHDHTYPEAVAAVTTEEERPSSKFLRNAVIIAIVIVALGAAGLIGSFLVGRAEHKRLSSAPADTGITATGTPERPVHISGTIELTGLPDPADFAPIMVNGDCNEIPEAAFTSGRPVMINGKCNKATNGVVAPATASSSP